ncbi:RluA family pseudouridine synthase [Halosquirtibacter laminarini]|uniref:RluA family pseudouridine synthase n=1 Tax=Halosquirtibacter laminarini TaxID=3374600 RepID=A0AC61NCZ0_9BACT|nr:RluA family pseudouridine synthase [Prolixibacteraceae bacterium]
MQKKLELVSCHVIPQIDEGIRLYNYLIGIFVELPSGKSVKKAIKNGHIFVDGETASSGLWVKEGMNIALYHPAEATLKPYSTDLDIVYEDNWLAVVNKPAGLTTSGNRFDTLENAVQGKLQYSNAPDAYVNFRAVHRLDKATSGLVIIAKTKKCRIMLGQMLESKEITKKYYAIIMGDIQDNGVCCSPINNTNARTLFEKIDSVPSLRSKRLTLVQLSPITGRTHQLRIHMAQKGTPILGDTLYGTQGNILKGKGLFLCAYFLFFKHPFTQESMNMKIELPHKYKKRMEIEKTQYHKYV